MNRTIKDASVHRYYYQSHEQLQSHLDTFLCAYNFAKLLKTLKGMTPYQFIVKYWGDNTDVFLDDPGLLNLGRYNYIPKMTIDSNNLLHLQPFSQMPQLHS